MKLVTLVAVFLLTPGLRAAPLYSVGVSLSNDGQAGITAFNSNTLEEIGVSSHLESYNSR